jgi:hypothetical protein
MISADYRLTRVRQLLREWRAGNPELQLALVDELEFCLNSEQLVEVMQAGTADGEVKEERLPNVTERTTAYVKRWLEGVAKRLRHDDCDVAELRIRAHSPGWDDDNTCCLTVDMEERISVDSCDGRVEGVK